MLLQNIRYKAVNAVRAVIGCRVYRANRLKIILQNHRILVAEAENGSRLCAGGAGSLHGLQHRRNTDAAADKYRTVTEAGQVKAVADRSENIQRITDLALRQPLGAFALDNKDDF